MKPNSTIIRILILALGVMYASGANAQLTVFNGNVPSGFAEAGYIQAATLDNPADPKSGGTLTMNGTTMIVPANSVVQFPANTLTWADLFNKLSYAPVYDPAVPAQAAPAITAGTTGLALVDNPAQALGQSPDLPFNAIVIGNVDVKNAAGHGAGAYIVGLILPIGQDLGNTGQGFITFIDYAKGRFEVGGTLGIQNTGTVIEINDPTGRYGFAHSPDPRWSADPDNPTITTGNGYPMCLPKLVPPAIDPDCPIFNRPLNPPIGAKGHDPFLQAGAPLQVFFMPASRKPGATKPDPWKKVPLMLGDYIVYSGVLYKNDPTAAFNPATRWNRQTYISANTVGVDKLAVYTQAGRVGTVGPAYIQVQGRMIAGTGGGDITVPPNPALGTQGGVIPLAEPKLNFEIRGFVTDSTKLVDIFAVDIDPLSGKEIPRLLGTVLPEAGILGNPPRGNKGRFRFVIDKTNLQPTTRVYMVKTHHGTVQLQPQVGNIHPAKGLLAGQYHAPMFGFLYPDGPPGFPNIPNNFQSQQFLIQGEGGNPSAGPLFPLPPFLP